MRRWASGWWLQRGFPISYSYAKPCETGDFVFRMNNHVYCDAEHVLMALADDKYGVIRARFAKCPSEKILNRWNRL
jgi:hypothetical protein